MVPREIAEMIGKYLYETRVDMDEWLRKVNY